MSVYQSTGGNLSEEQIELLQEFIKNTEEGTYEAMSLIPGEYLECFDAPQMHGRYFKALVESGRLSVIRMDHFDMNSKHYFYRVFK